MFSENKQSFNHSKCIQTRIAYPYNMVHRASQVFLAFPRLSLRGEKKYVLVQEQHFRIRCCIRLLGLLPSGTISHLLLHCGVIFEGKCPPLQHILISFLSYCFHIIAFSFWGKSRFKKNWFSFTVKPYINSTFLKLLYSSCYCEYSYAVILSFFPSLLCFAVSLVGFL